MDLHMPHARYLAAAQISPEQTLPRRGNPPLQYFLRERCRSHLSASAWRARPVSHHHGIWRACAATRCGCVENDCTVRQQQKMAVGSKSGGAATVLLLHGVRAADMAYFLHFLTSTSWASRAKRG